MSGTVLAGRYRLDEMRLDPSASAVGAAQFDATDISSLESVSVRLVPVERLVDPAMGSTTPADAVAAFEAQMDLAIGLKHPCIETVLDHGDVTLDGDRYVFSVAERLAGGSLQDFVDRGRRLTPSQALIVGIDVCRALDVATKMGITHGDLRPSRLVFGLDRRVRLVGFGAPQKRSDALSLEQANYSAPEVLEGGARTASSDVYSVALILVQAMTGETPFAGDSVQNAAANRQGKLLPVSADFGALAQVIERAGRPTASERFTPREFGQALVKAAEEMPRPTPIDIVGTGLFDAEVASTDPSSPAARPDLSDQPPVPNVAPDQPILIRTTPQIPGRDPTNPVVIAIADPTDPSGMTRGIPLTIGGDETGPVVLDPEMLRILAAQDPTAQVAAPKKKRWALRISLFLLVVALVVAGGVGAYYTVLNPKNPVPALTGLAEAEARNQVSKYGWNVIIKKERSDEVAAGSIIRTDPVFGANLAKRESLTLVVSDGPTLRTLVDLAGMTADVAKAKIAELQLVATQTDANDETVPVGTVISWSIPEQPTLKAGDEVVRGSTVALVVSAGPAARVVPDLTGKPVFDAAVILNMNGLVYAEAPEKKYTPDIPFGNVASQTPKAGEQLPKGGTVTVTISNGQTTTLIPTIYNRDYKTVKERLEKYGMVVGKVTGDKRRGLIKATIDGKTVQNLERVVVGKTVDLTFP